MSFPTHNDQVLKEKALSIVNVDEDTFSKMNTKEKMDLYYELLKVIRKRELRLHYFDFVKDHIKAYTIIRDQKISGSELESKERNGPTPSMISYLKEEAEEDGEKDIIWYNNKIAEESAKIENEASFIAETKFMKESSFYLFKISYRYSDLCGF